MSEKERERLYWRLFLGFALASPLSVYLAARSGFSPSFNPLPSTVVWFLSIPLTLLVEMLLATLFGDGRALRFWVVRPAVQVGRVLTLSAGPALASITSRLREFGFACTESEGQGGSTLLTFAKPPTRPINSFLDHGFFGEATLGPAEAGTSLTCRLTFDDTLLLDTGEFEQLRELCNYFTLQSQGFTHSNVPLTLVCGLCLSFVTAASTLTPQRVVGDETLTCLSMSAAGLLAAGMFFVLRDREHLFGGRLFFGGMYLASLPFLAWLGGVAL
ncbi:MAG TPA: hypothetical protein VN282_19360 [Pyrinomonadaceae bacterium]|nr:hypothetical protein [Pyrinomonadaceae bacterium]